VGPVVLLPMFILFQPEVRRALITTGAEPAVPHVSSGRTGASTDELVKATFSLSRDKVGGLIAIEREVGLRGYVEGGVRLDAEVSAELDQDHLLARHAAARRRHRHPPAAHRGGRLPVPLTDNPQFSAEMGTRHRAGIGVTEESDAAAVIISEQTGQVSLAVGGTLQRDMDERALRRALEELSTEIEERQ